MQKVVKRMDKESIIYDTATISDIPELVRLRILYPESVKLYTHLPFRILGFISRIQVFAVLLITHLMVSMMLVIRNDIQIALTCWKWV